MSVGSLFEREIGLDEVEVMTIAPLFRIPNLIEPALRSQGSRVIAYSSCFTVHGSRRTAAAPWSWEPRPEGHEDQREPRREPPRVTNVQAFFPSEGNRFTTPLIALLVLEPDEERA